jgi:hypothetical protein
MFSNNKRGVISDIYVWVLVFFGIVVFSLAGTLMFDMFNDAVQGGDFSADAKNPTQNMRDEVPPGLDSGLLLVFFGAHISIIFFAFLLRSHMIVFPFMFLLLVMLVVMSGFLGNAWEDIVSIPELETIQAEYPMTTWLMDNFMMANLFMGFLDLIIFLGLGAIVGGGGI